MVRNDNDITCSTTAVLVMPRIEVVDNVRGNLGGSFKQTESLLSIYHRLGECKYIYAERGKDRTVYLHAKTLVKGK